MTTKKLRAAAVSFLKPWQALVVLASWWGAVVYRLVA